MADDIDKVASEMKELAASIKEVSRFSKDMSEAVSAMVRPLQQSTEYMKTVAAQSADMEEKFTATVDMQKKLMDVMTESIAVQKVKNRLGEDEEALKTRIKVLEAEALEVGIKRKGQITEEYDLGKASAAQRLLMSEYAKLELSTLERAKAVAREHKDELVNQGYELKKNQQGVEKLVEKEGEEAKIARESLATMKQKEDSAKAIKDTYEKIKNLGASLLGSIGIGGGLFGALMFGLKRNSEFEAIGNNAAQQFDMIGTHVDGLSARFSGLARQFDTVGYGSKEEVIAVAKAFADSGISAEEATRKVQGFSSVIGRDLIAYTIAADKTLELAAGTTAKMAGTLKTDFNEAAEGAVTRLLNIGTAAKQAGLNQVTFMQQTMDAASSLRMLNANFEDFGTLQLKMTKIMKDKKFNEQFAGQYAAAGAKGIGSAVGGMGDGMLAILSEKMGIKGDALDRIYAMKSSMGRESGDQFQAEKMVVAMRDIMTSAIGGNRSKGEQFKFLTDGPMKLDTAAADLVIHAIGQIQSGQGLDGKTKKGLEQGILSEKDKRNQMEQNIKIIADAVGNVMVGLLGMVVNGLKAVYNVIMLGAAMTVKAISSIPGASMPEGLDEYIAGARSNIASNVRDMGTSATSVGNGMTQLVKAGGRQLNLAGLNSENMSGAIPVYSKADKEALREVAQGQAQVDEERKRREKALVGSVVKTAKGIYSFFTGDGIEITVNDKRASGNKSY